MTTIILVILGVLLAAASVLFVIYYGGDAFGNGHIEAEAGRLVGEGAQMEAALELYYRQEGHYPRSDDPVAELISAGYLDYQPLGTRTTEADRWSIDYDAGMIMARLGQTDHEESSSICLKARQQLDLPAANTSTGIYRCDGSDSPGGRLAGREPCCIGEVPLGGGAITPVVQYPVRTTGTTDADSAKYLLDMGNYMAAAGIAYGDEIADINDVTPSPVDFSGISAEPKFFTSMGPTSVYRAPHGDYIMTTTVSDGVCDAINAAGDPKAYCTDRSVTRTYNYFVRNLVELRPAHLASIVNDGKSIHATMVNQDLTFANDYANHHAPLTTNLFTRNTTISTSASKNLFVRYQLRGDSRANICHWYRASIGDTAPTGTNAINESKPFDCNATYFYYKVTDPIRSNQIRRIKSEVGRAKSLLASSGVTSPTSTAAFGYQPNFGGMLTNHNVFTVSGITTLRVYTQGFECNVLRQEQGQPSVAVRPSYDRTLPYDCDSSNVVYGRLN